MDVPPNPDPLLSVFGSIGEFLSSYGWTCLFIVVTLNLIWSHFYPKYKNWRERREEVEKEAEYKKDPSLLIAREEALVLARQRLQEKHDQLAREHEEKMRLKEEQKRKEKLEAMENLLKGKSTKPRTSDESLRPKFNPLMGSSGGSCFRPSPRGGSGRGG